MLTDVERDRRSGPETIEDELIARKSERQFQGLAEGLPVICWTADATGSFDWYNHRWYEFTGQTPEEAVGWGWQAMHHPDDFLDVMRKWPHSIATGEPFEMEFRLRRRDGEYRWFIARAEPLRDDAGRVVRWYGSNVDIDEQKRAHERTKQIAETLDISEGTVRAHVTAILRKLGVSTRTQAVILVTELDLERDGADSV